MIKASSQFICKIVLRVKFSQNYQKPFCLLNMSIFREDFSVKSRLGLQFNMVALLYKGKEDERKENDQKSQMADISLTITCKELNNSPLLRPFVSFQ